MSEALDNEYWQTATPETIQESMEASGLYDDGWTPLIYAAYKNAPASVFEMLEKAGADFTHQDNNGLRAIHWAIMCHEQAPVIDFLLKRDAKASLDEVIKGNTYLLLAATHNRSAGVIKYLLNKDTPTHFVNMESGSGLTPVMYALKYNENTKILNHFLEAGAKVDAQARDVWGEPILHAAIAYNKNPSIASFLLDRGASVNEQDEDKETALMVACRHARLEVAKMLIDKGAEINTRNVQKHTALMYACGWDPYSHSTEIVKLLLDNGADVHKSDEYHNTAIHWALQNAGTPEETIKLLLDAGADVTKRNRLGLTAWDFIKSNYKDSDVYNMIKNKE